MYQPRKVRYQPSSMNQLRNLSSVLSEASSAVRGLLNAATSINSLPPELLARIFTEYATDEFRHGPCSFHPFRMPSPRAAVRLSEVCKHWRDVALSTARLWSGITCGGRNQTPFNRYLHLSRSSALRVIVNGDVETVGELFRDQPSRVRHLLLLDISDNWARRRDPRDLLSVVAPDLLSCTLDIRMWPRGGLPEHSYSLFAGNARDLCELVIHNTTVIPMDGFPSLTHLMLTEIAGIPSLPHLLALLGRCPRLEEVCFQSTRETARLPSTPPSPVALPHLRRISLYIRHSLWLVSRIIVPPTCLVRLDEVSLNDALTLSQSPLCQQLDSSRLTRLAIYSKSSSSLMQSWMNEFCVELADATCTSGLFLSINAPSSTAREHISAALASAFGANPLFAHVSVLWAVRQQTSFVLTTSVLRALPALTTLGIVFDDRVRVPDLAGVLAAPDDPSLLVCPDLATLCVQNCKTVEGGLESVQRIVETRAQRGSRVRRLAIECPNTLRSRALVLRDCVDDMVVHARFDGEARLPARWREEAESVDSGVWPDWAYFVNESRP